MFVQRAKGGVLARRLREIEHQLNKLGDKRVKIVEEGGGTNPRVTSKE